MNKEAVRQAEVDFLNLYPQGFADPEMQQIAKKHKVAKMTDLARQFFEPSAFENPEAVVAAMIKLVGQSSMVSMFEKPKFRDYVSSLPAGEAEALAAGLYDFLHAEQQKGFERMLDVLLRGKLAKWSLMTILPNYYHPNTEVFVKPTTTKGIIEQFELKGLEYKPRPGWDFYQRYRDEILAMKTLVDPSLAPSNAAFCGFLMMSSHRK